MEKKNKVFFATSSDGYIADQSGGLDWLHSVPNPDHNDMGYSSFMSEVDALIMGRNTFETVCGFDMDWPYDKPVFVLSNSLQEIPNEYVGKAKLVKGELTDIIKEINSKGHQRLYIDGGSTIKNFLKEDLIDEMIITTIPVMLGGGTPLFTEPQSSMGFIRVETKMYLDTVAQNRFVRMR